MAKLRADSLDDLNGISAQMRVTCRECDHSALYLTREIVAYFKAKGWSRLFAHAEVKFRCDQCGARNAAFRAYRPASPPSPPKPAPLPHPDDRPRGSRRR